MSKIELLLAICSALALFTILLYSRKSSAKKITIPLDSKLSFEDTYTIIWNGYSRAYIYKDQNWLRAETFDYYFDVIQKRYKKEWKSVKSLHRIHPDYNGKAGQRDQTMYFGIQYQVNNKGKVNGSILSSLGAGTIETDKEFRQSLIDIDLKDAGMFMPYNKIRITQHYDYEQGKLTETVLLLSVKNGKETPFMKNEEEAFFYIKGRLDQAPTIFE